MLVHLLAQADKLNALLTPIHSNMDGPGQGKKVCSLLGSTTFRGSTTLGEQVPRYLGTLGPGHYTNFLSVQGRMTSLLQCLDGLFVRLVSEVPKKE